MLEAIKTRFQQLAEAVTGPPSRDALVAERDQLLAAVPPGPESMLTPPTPPACPCPHCTERASAEQALRVTFASWASRVQACESGLFALTWGESADEPGKALVGLLNELLAAFEATKSRAWERRIEYDARGRETAAWETAPALAAVLAELAGLARHARERLPFLGTDELLAAIANTRAARATAITRPLERPIPPEVATRAGTTARPASEAERHGLAVAPGADKSVLSGTVRFSRRDRA